MNVVFTMYDESTTGRERVIRAYPGRVEITCETQDVFVHSGDWASRVGRFRSDDGLRELARWYSEFDDKENIVRIAPNSRQREQETMRLYARWHQLGLGKVTPVIECTAGLRDLFAIRRQAAYYAKCGASDRVCLANPLKRAKEIRGNVVRACEIIREMMGDVSIHVLGAGWSAEDIEQWAALGCIDSIDSTAYYEDAKAGKRWQVMGNEYGYELTGTSDWKEIALHNAQMAVNAARRGAAKIGRVLAQKTIFAGMKQGGRYYNEYVSN